MNKFESVPNANTLHPKLPPLSLPLPWNTHRIILALLCNHHYSALIEASALNRYCQIAQCLPKIEQVICGKQSSPPPPLPVYRECLGCTWVPTYVCFPLTLIIINHIRAYACHMQFRLELREINVIMDKIKKFIIAAYLKHIRA